MVSAMVDRDRPLKNRYLDVITAIEAHDYTEHGEGPIERATFKKRRSEAMLAVPDATARRFLNSWTPRKSSFSLEQRLERTRAALGLSWDESAATMAQLRNDIAHGNMQPDYWTLERCFQQALLAARLLALNDVGAYVVMSDGDSPPGR